MFEAINSLAERREPIKRNDSFSTVNSSVAAAEILQQYADLRRKISKDPTLSPNHPVNIKFENSDNINIVYNQFYNNSSPDEIRSSRRNSISSFFSENLEKFKTNTKCWKFQGRRKRISIIIIFVAVILLAIISTITYHLMKSKTNGNDELSMTTEPSRTSKSPSDSTSTSITTTRISDQTTHQSQTTISEQFVSTEKTLASTEESSTTETIILHPDYLVTRDQWGAEDPRSQNIPLLEDKIKRIIIGHTGGQFCTNEASCIETVKSIQSQDLSLDDIPYNFLIGGDGKVYQGRGFKFEGQHTKNIDATEYNSIGIFIAFIGNYQSTPPTLNQMILIQDFIDFFIGTGTIIKDYLIFSQDDLIYRDIKAEALNGAVEKLKNFHELTKIYRREEWNATSPIKIKTFNRAMNWILIGHITKSCNDLTSCAKEIKKEQDANFKDSKDDIRYNFMVGGDGLIFEGRGWDNIGEQVNDFKDISISLMVFGDYRYLAPPPNLPIAMLNLFNDGLVLGKLTEDYIINGLSDFGMAGPGDLLMRIIKKWDRYRNIN